MPRPLTELRTPEDPLVARRDRGLNRRTSRSFAAAVAVLVLATVVVDRSDAALSGVSANAASAVNSGTVALDDDDEGRSLFLLDDLTPARPSVRCIEITYGGTILPVSLELQARAQGDLSRHLRVAIDEGDGGGYGSCDGFLASGSVFDGPLDELTGAGWLDVGTLVNTGERRTFRIALQLEDDQEALGLSTSLEFAWEVTPA